MVLPLRAVGFGCSVVVFLLQVEVAEKTGMAYYYRHCQQDEEQKLVSGCNESLESYHVDDSLLQFVEDVTIKVTMFIDWVELMVPYVRCLWQVLNTHTPWILLKRLSI